MNLTNSNFRLPKTIDSLNITIMTMGLFTMLLPVVLL